MTTRTSETTPGSVARDPGPLRRKPRPAPPPLESAKDWRVVLVRSAGDHPERPDRWPVDAARERLAARVALRLPGASFRTADPETVADAQRILAAPGVRRIVTLEAGRSFCGFSVKDGQIAVAELHAVATQPGATPIALPV